MAPESEPDEAHRDETATEPPADEPPGSEHDEDTEESGGPYGNPESNEETLRQHQEESSDRSGSE